MYRLIEVYGEAGVSEPLVAPALYEDDDGIRILVIADPELPVRLWVKAHASGAVAIVLLPDGEDAWGWVLAEDFMEFREEDPRKGVFTLPHWAGSEEALTYRQMRAQPRLERPRIEVPNGGFVHLHAHSEFSPLDGLSKVSEMVETVVAHGQSALAITDHGICANHPYLQSAADEAGIKPIFGIEAYLVDDRFRRAPERKKDMTDEEKEVHERLVAEAKDYYHLVLWAQTTEGLHNLWAMSTEANRDGFYTHPRLDWDTLRRLNAGVMASTACLRGPLAKPLLEGNEDVATANLARLMDIFDDRLYVEIHTNGIEEQVRVNHELVRIARSRHLPLIAVSDSHYPAPEHKKVHKVWIAMQTKSEIQDEEGLFEGEHDYHLFSEEEVRKALSYLPTDVVDEAVANTAVVAGRCEARIEGSSEVPTYSKEPTEELSARRDVERLVDLCLANWGRKVVGKPKPESEYEARFEREMRLLIDKGFCGYFLMVSDYCLAAKEGRVDGTPMLVGPGRGSGGGSLVAYLCGITEIDPVDADLMFERFLTEGRKALPDFDVDFPRSKRGVLTQYVTDKYGDDHVVRVGTHLRLKNKGVIRDLARTLKSEIEIDYRDVDAFAKFVDQAESGEAGLGLSWEDLWDQHGDVLDVYRERYPLIFAYADQTVGRLKSYGKHAAGLVIDPKRPLTGRLPMRRAAADEPMVSEFDMEALEELGFVKFDLLTLRTLDTIQECLDLIREQTGQVINIYDWKGEYDDPAVWDLLCEGRTLGVFQIETRDGTRLTKRFQPRSVSDLADVITLVRPGPMRSGLTETYFRRRAGQEPVTVPDPRLEPVLTKTYGCLIYQEDILATCMVLGGYTPTEADVIRKVLGKKQVEKVEEAGKEFIRRCVENGGERGAIEALWAQMAEFAKYSFNRAHAFGYAMVGHWCGWPKAHHPLQFITAALSTVDDDRYSEFITEARRMEFQVLPPDVNESKLGFSSSGSAIRYGLDAVKGVGEAGALAVIEGQPYRNFDDFLARKGSACNMGTVRTLASVGAFDSMVPHRRALEARLEWEASGESERCQFKRDDVVGPNGLPCTFDWDNEPPRLGKSGKPLKQKPIPKRCTKACRQYVAQSPRDFGTLPLYSKVEVRDREAELLGTYVSSTPFDFMDTEDFQQWAEGQGFEVMTADELDAKEPGVYMTVGLVRRQRRIVTRNSGKAMAFVTLFARNGEFDLTVFPRDWKTYKGDLDVGEMVACYVRKQEDNRGYILEMASPLRVEE